MTPTIAVIGGGPAGLYLARLLKLAAPAAKGNESLIQNDLGWILLAFAIFNTYMLLWSTQVTSAVFAVFLTLEATEIILFIGNFSHNASTVKIGGWIGVLTALVAWYTSAAGVVNGMGGRLSLPVGGPFGASRAAAGGTSVTE